MAHAGGGYDVTLVTEPDAIKYDCSICQLILRTPCETECCNNFMCLSCIEEFQRKAVNANCPFCRKDLRFRRAVAQERQINQLKVRCCNQLKNCMWVGELGDLEGHLNINYSANTIDKGCDYVEIECPVCNEHFQRLNLSQHKLDECPNEEVACIYHKKGCEWRGQRKNMEEHLKLDQRYDGCGYVKWLCIHQCGKSEERRNLQHHERKCLKEIVKCEFQSMGCQAEFFREDADEHFTSYRDKHVNMLCKHCKNISNETLPNIQSKIVNLEENYNEQNYEPSFQELRHSFTTTEAAYELNIEALKADFKSLKSTQNYFIGICVTLLIAVVFRQIFPDSSPEIIPIPDNSSKTPVSPIPFRPEFLLPTESYVTYDKAVLGRDVTSMGSAVFVPSIKVLPVVFIFELFASIETDGSPTLSMCFEKALDSDHIYDNATVFVQVVNQVVKTNKHHVTYFNLNFSQTIKTKRDTVHGGCNILLSKVKRSFIKNNLIRLRVLSMEFNDNTYLPCTFSLCQYSDYFGTTPKHKVWTSNPFYFSPGGYKFVLKVYPAGINDGLGTHLSFFVTVDMSTVSRPFIGNVTVFFAPVLASEIRYTIPFNGKQNTLGYANSVFMEDSEVKSKLLSYDCIILGISDIQVAHV